MTRTTTRTRRLATAPAALLLLALGACSSGSDAEDGGGADKKFSSASAEDAPMAAFDADGGGADAVAASRALSIDEDQDDQEAAVIRTGQVTLESDDVAEAKDDVERVVDRYLGEVSDERTESDDEGVMESTRMVVRVPSEDFTEALDALSEVGDLREATSKAQDVTTEVIDTRVRIRAQEKSLRRVEQLLARATSIGDIVRIEGQLTRRQADLDSLKGRMAYLTDRTSLGTITVRVDRVVEPRPEKKPEEKDAGFVAGLSGGWDALTAVAVALATAAGALLPFALAAALVGWPLLLLTRRISARRTARTPSAG